MYKIKKDLQKDLSKAVEEFGYESEESFIEDALRRRILDLKKSKFLKGASVVRERMDEKGITEKEIFDDFDKIHHKNKYLVSR